MPVTPDDVVNAYRWLLGREPDEQGLRDWLGAMSRDDLRRAFVASPEFRRATLHLPAGSQENLSDERVPRVMASNHVEWQVDASLETQLVEHIERTWNRLGNERPHWSVLSSDRFLPENIGAHQVEFYTSGSADVDLITDIMDANEIGAHTVRSVVEFGCGVGRVTPYLAAKFQRITAIDISESHIAMARQRCAGHACVAFERASLPDFGMLEPFDLWFSYIVLQHNPPPVIARILARAFRMLAPGGVAIFQVPTWCDGYRFRLTDYLDSRAAEGMIEVHCLPQRVIFDLAHAAGCIPIEVRQDAAMRPPEWASHVFAFRKESSVRRNSLQEDAE